jgi:hypothetical protein
VARAVSFGSVFFAAKENEQFSRQIAAFSEKRMDPGFRSS